MNDYTGLKSLYGRTSAEQIDDLIESIDALAAQAQTLRTRPSPDGAERIGGQLHGMARCVSQLVTTMVMESRE